MQLTQRGSINAGTMYVVAIMVLLVVFASVLTNGVVPSKKSPTGTPITIVPHQPTPGKSNLQLYTFGFTTPGPTTSAPTPTPTQQGPYCPGETSGKARACECEPGRNDWVFCKEDPCNNPSAYDKSIGQGNWTSFGVPADYTCMYSREGGNPISLYEQKKADPECYLSCIGKPVIYLYPQKPTLVDVKLTIPGRIYISDPFYPKEGWENVLAHPDGKLIYQGKSYHELYYESEVEKVNAPETGIIIARKDLKEKLTEFTTRLGLIKHEQDEFLEYWMPQLDELNSPFVLFSVIEPSEKERIDHVDISPKPDTFIGFLAHFKPVKTPPTNLKPLILPQNPPERVGFTAVEWGGTIAY